MNTQNENCDNATHIRYHVQKMYCAYELGIKLKPTQTSQNSRNTRYSQSGARENVAPGESVATQRLLLYLTHTLVQYQLLRSKIIQYTITRDYKHSRGNNAIRRFQFSSALSPYFPCRFYEFQCVYYLRWLVNRNISLHNMKQSACLIS